MALLSFVGDTFVSPSAIVFTIAFCVCYPGPRCSRPVCDSKFETCGEWKRFLRPMVDPSKAGCFLFVFKTGKLLDVAQTRDLVWLSCVLDRVLIKTGDCPSLGRFVKSMSRVTRPIDFSTIIKITRGSALDSAPSPGWVHKPAESETQQAWSWTNPTISN